MWQPGPRALTGDNNAFNRTGPPRDTPVPVFHDFWPFCARLKNDEKITFSERDQKVVEVDICRPPGRPKSTLYDFGIDFGLILEAIFMKSQ